MTWDDEIDTSGLNCPLPVLKARKRLKGMSPGAVLRLVTSDPAAAIDIPHFCTESGHELVSRQDMAAGHVWMIRRAPGRSKGL